MKTLKINGVEKHFTDMPATLAELLAELEINEATVVAEINGRVIERKEFAGTKLYPDQSIELVRFVGGG